VILCAFFPTNSKTAIIYFGEMLVASLLAIVLLAISQLRMSSDAVLFAGGVVAWTLAEYVVHRFVLHGFAPTEHRLHHANPDDAVLTIFWQIWICFALVYLINRRPSSIGTAWRPETGFDLHYVVRQQIGPHGNGGMMLYGRRACCDAVNGDPPCTIHTIAHRARRTAPVSHQKRPHRDALNTIVLRRKRTEINEADLIPPLITVWLQVRVRANYTISIADLHCLRSGEVSPQVPRIHRSYCSE
jgi:hypothetical protein